MGPSITGARAVQCGNSLEPSPTCAQADTLTLTHTHMHRHMDMDRHVSVHRRHISTTHSHACLRVHTCALTSHSHAARVCTRQNSVCLCTHRKTRMHTHTHTHFITRLNATQSRCGVSIPPEASPLPLSGLALTCTSMHVSVSLLTSHPCVSQLRSWVQRVGPRVSGKTTLESLCRHPL